jgi:hypothetical protein
MTNLRDYMAIGEDIPRGDVKIFKHLFNIKVKLWWVGKRIWECEMAESIDQRAKVAYNHSY